ncbi:MAG TPA: hypothetical protein VGQ59_03465, partial [Cyclobacteriaceae bacterium]|nr:hypothetical protein [Cyclobacteriaceae bacterium]
MSSTLIPYSMRVSRLAITVAVLSALSSSAQVTSKQDSVQQVIYQSALQKLKDGGYAEASAQFTQLIT